MKYQYEIPDCPKCGHEMTKIREYIDATGHFKDKWVCKKCGKALPYLKEDEAKKVK